MNEKQARQLKVHDKVLWNKNIKDKGIVSEVCERSIHILWENGIKGWIHFNDCKLISKEKELS